MRFVRTERGGEKRAKNARDGLRILTSRAFDFSKQSDAKSVSAPDGMAPKSSSKYVNDPSSRSSTKTSSQGNFFISGTSDACTPTKNGIGAVR